MKEDKKLIFKGKNKIDPINLNLNDFFGSSPKTIIEDQSQESKFMIFTFIISYVIDNVSDNLIMVYN